MQNLCHWQYFYIERFVTVILITTITLYNNICYHLRSPQCLLMTSHPSKANENPCFPLLIDISFSFKLIQLVTLHFSNDLEEWRQRPCSVLSIWCDLWPLRVFIWASWELRSAFCTNVLHLSCGEEQPGLLQHLLWMVCSLWSTCLY